jgi:hypothetical protein
MRPGLLLSVRVVTAWVLAARRPRRYPRLFASSRRGALTHGCRAGGDGRPRAAHRPREPIHSSATPSPGERAVGDPCEAAHRHLRPCGADVPTWYTRSSASWSARETSDRPNLRNRHCPGACGRPASSEHLTSSTPLIDDCGAARDRCVTTKSRPHALHAREVNQPVSPTR